jgi:hypothetical protein
LVGVARKWLPALPQQAKRANLIRSDLPPPPGRAPNNGSACHLNISLPVCSLCSPARSPLVVWCPNPGHAVPGDQVGVAMQCCEPMGAPLRCMRGALVRLIAVGCGQVLSACRSTGKWNAAVLRAGVHNSEVRTEVLELGRGSSSHDIGQCVVMADQDRMQDLPTCLRIRNPAGTACVHVDVVGVASQRSCLYCDSWRVQLACKHPDNGQRGCVWWNFPISFVRADERGSAFA